MADNIGPVTVGTRQDLKDHETTQSSGGYCAAKTPRENSTSTPLLHLPRLHALNPLPIRRAVEAAGVPSSLGSTEELLVRLHARTQGRGLEGLRPGYAWLAAHCPPAVGPARILHEDFHPGNV